MNLGLWWIIDVIGPVILLIVLVSLIPKFSSSHQEALQRPSRKVMRELVRDEEERRREGTHPL